MVQRAPFAAILAFALLAAAACKGKSEKKDETNPPATFRGQQPESPRPAPHATNDKVEPARQPAPLPPPTLPTDFGKKMAAFYEEAIGILSAEPKACAAMGQKLQQSLERNKELLAGLAGRPAEQTRWRESNKELESRFQKVVGPAVRRCVSDATFRAWMQGIQRHVARYTKSGG